MNLIGILISVIGVFLVILQNDLSISTDPVGLMFLLTAVLSAVFYSVIIVRISLKYNIYTIITVQNTIGVILFIPTFFIIDYSNFINIGFKIEVLIPLLELAVFGSTLAFLLFTYTINKPGIIKADSFGNIIPVFTVAFAFLILDQRPTFINIAGILVVISGLFLSQTANKKLKKLRHKVNKKSELSKINDL